MIDKTLDIANHQWNIQVLMTEIFNITSNLASPIIDNIIGTHRNLQ